MIIIDDTEHTLPEWFIKKYNITLHRAFVKRENEHSVLLMYLCNNIVTKKWINKKLFIKVI